MYWALVSAKPAHGRVTEGTVYAAVAQFKRMRYGPDGKLLNMKISAEASAAAARDAADNGAYDSGEDASFGEVGGESEGGGPRGHRRNKKEGYRWSRQRKRESQAGWCKSCSFDT